MQTAVIHTVLATIRFAKRKKHFLNIEATQPLAICVLCC